jgi:hypothetical protein
MAFTFFIVKDIETFYSNYIKQLWISITSAHVGVKLEGLLS